MAPWPYVLLGCGYAALAAGMLVQGARRQRELERAVVANEHTPLSYRVVALFTIAALLVALATVVLVVAQT